MLAALGLAAVALVGRRERAPDPPSGPPREVTWWAVDAAEADARPDEALARQLSLPYAAGGVARDGERFGVRSFERASAQPGWNLYVSAHAAEAILMAMDGTPLHRWRLDAARAFPGVAPTADSGFFRRAALLPDGSLLALVQGMGLLRLDAGSRLVWRHAAPLFNDFWLSAAGDRILVLAKRGVARPDLRAGGPLLEDALVVLDGDGRERERASLLAAFERSAWRHLLVPLGASADAFHTNTIEVLGGPGTRPGTAFAPGNLLVSMREIDTVAVLSADAREVLWAQRGPFRGQHEPSLLPDGRLLLFDNLGRGGGLARVVALDPASGALAEEWLGPPGRALASRQAGACRRLGNGDLLVVESERGAAWELDAARRVVWEFRSPHRAGARRELVAVLLDLVRYEEATPFLARFPPAQAP